jgi:N-carbamoylputrescine amidase
MKPGDVELFDRMIKRSAPYYARTLGVPVDLADRTGAIHTSLPGGYDDFHSSFPGLSQIVDADGRVQARLGEEEGVLVAKVELSLARKKLKKPRCYGKMWAFPMPWFAFIWPQTQLEGEQAYQNNQRRRERALAIGTDAG